MQVGDGVLYHVNFDEPYSRYGVISKIGNNGLIDIEEDGVYSLSPHNYMLTLSHKIAITPVFPTKNDVEDIITKAEEVAMNEEDVVSKPNHYQLFPEYNLEVKDINKKLLDCIEESDFKMSLYQAGWYQQSMQYFMRFYNKNGLEDLKKGIQTMQFVVDSIEKDDD